MDRKTHVRFLGGHARVTAHGYPTNRKRDEKPKISALRRKADKISLLSLANFFAGTFAGVLEGVLLKK